MSKLKLPVAITLALSAFAVALPSQAQTSPSDDRYTYLFNDDDLLGGTLDTTSALIRVRPDAARVTLIRPRASFVPEMLKSIELM